MNKEYIKNVYLHIKETLADFSSTQRQYVYKTNVPFVHIPLELFEQWSTYTSEVFNSQWFSMETSENCIKRINNLDKTIQRFLKDTNHEYEDVPEIFNDYRWINIGEKAKELLDFLNNENCLEL